MTYRRRFVILFSLLILASFVATWGNVEAFWHANHPSLQVSERDIYIRLIREGILLVIYWDAFLLFIKHRESIFVSRLWAAFGALVLTYIVFCILLSAMNRVPMIAALAGLRMFQYMPLIFVAYVVAYYYGNEPFKTIGRVLMLYVFVQSVLAVYELLFLPGFVFGRTFLGPRPFGTLPSPIHFGLTMSACALYFSFLNRRYWVFVCVFLCVASGSRTAMLAVCLVLGYMVIRRFPVWDRVVLVLMGLPLAYLAYSAVSTRSLSGRELKGEARVDVWLQALDNIQGAGDFLFGWGVGLGANTLGTLFGRGYLQGQYMSDSVFIFLIGSYGMIGVLLYLAAIMLLLYNHRRDLRMLILLTALLFFSAVFTIWELFPLNALLCVMLGWLIGVKQFRRRIEV